jgi:hypothetical protein
VQHHRCPFRAAERCFTPVLGQVSARSARARLGL